MPYCAGNNIENYKRKSYKNAGYGEKFYLEAESLRSMDDKILSYIDFCNYKLMYSGVRYRTPSENVAKALSVV